MFKKLKKHKLYRMKRIPFFFIISLIYISTACNNLFHGIPGIENFIFPGYPETLEITQTYPSNGDVNIPLNKTIMVMFNKNIELSTINNNTFKVIKTTGADTVTPVSGEFTFNDNIVIFDPEYSNDMDPLVDSSVTITSGIRDIGNRNMTSDYTWSFRTGNIADREPPEVVSTEPTAYIFSTNGITAKAIFNEDINPSSISTSNFILIKIESDSSETDLQGTVSYDANSKTATFTPDDPLEIEGSYKSIILSGEQNVQDLAGNAMLTDKAWNFRHLRTYDTPCEIPFLTLDCCE